MFADPYTYQYSEIDKNEPLSPVLEHHSAPSSSTEAPVELLQESFADTNIGASAYCSPQPDDSIKELEGSTSPQTNWSMPDFLTPGRSTPCEIVKLVRAGTSSEPSSPYVSLKNFLLHL